MMIRVVFARSSGGLQVINCLCGSRVRSSVRAPNFAQDQKSPECISSVTPEPNRSTFCHSRPGAFRPNFAASVFASMLRYQFAVGVGGVPVVIESPANTTRWTPWMSWWLVPLQWDPITGWNWS